MNSEPTKDLILARMQRLACLGFEGQPAAELIEGTGRLWVEKLAACSAGRLTAAFDAIEAHRPARRNDGGGWPAPGDIMRAMPTYAASVPLAPPERQIAADPEAKARISAAAREAIDGMRRKFSVESEAEAQQRIENERARLRAEIARRTELAPGAPE